MGGRGSSFSPQVVETGFPEFATFSVGEGSDRRTVVCFQQQLLDFTLGLSSFEQAAESEPESCSDSDRGKNSECDEEMGEGVGDGGLQEDASLDSDFDSLNGEARLEEAAGCSNGHREAESRVQDDAGDGRSNGPGPAPPSRRAVAPGRHKRPERAVYVPPSRSQPLNPSAPPYISPTTSPTRASSSPLNPSAPPWVSPPSSPTPPCTSPEPPKGRKKPARGIYVPPSVQRASKGRGKQVQNNAVREVEVRPASAAANSPSSWADEVEGLEVEEVVEEEVVEVGEDVTEQVVREITAAVGGVQIEAPVIDYLSFRTSDSTINIDQFGHVIELYDFSGHLTTPDLMAAFPTFTSRWRGITGTGSTVTGSCRGSSVELT